MPAATKPATQADMQKLEKRLTQRMDRMAIELVRTQADMRDMKMTMSTKADISRVLKAIDKFAERAEAYDHKALSHRDILINHESLLQDYGRRLSALESSP